MQMASTVITFSEHPRQVLQAGYVPELLTTLDDKLCRLEQTGIDRAVVLQFSREMARLSAREFMQEVLQKRLNVKKLIIGYDNRFGHNRTEGFDDYVRYGRELGIEVVHHAAFKLHDISVSSSVIRSLLHKGEVETAALCLGHPYAIKGTVVPGVQQGRRMGFPTANIDVSAFHLLVPANGVYAVKATVEGQHQTLPAMMNIGMRPTFNGTHITIEAHMINFNQDLYGKTLTLSFMHRIRQEQKFESVHALMKQLQADRQMVIEQFKKEQNNNE